MERYHRHLEEGLLHGGGTRGLGLLRAEIVAAKAPKERTERVRNGVLKSVVGQP